MRRTYWSDLSDAERRGLHLRGDGPSYGEEIGSGRSEACGAPILLGAYAGYSWAKPVLLFSNFAFHRLRDIRLRVLE